VFLVLVLRSNLLRGNEVFFFDRHASRPSLHCATADPRYEALFREKANHMANMVFGTEDFFG
jgi:hypothetical protein